MREVVALLAYAEDDAGGLMNPRFIRLRPDVSVEVAIRYIRAQAKAKVETIHYVYVLDHEQKLLGALSFRDLLLAPPDSTVSEMMNVDLITLPEDMDQEEVARQFSHSGLNALPVVDQEGRMKGIVTVDDAVEVVEEEATEDMHKLGGSEALDEPYLQISMLSMIKKRAGWLVILFVGEMLTATAMSYFNAEIERAVVLALFIPLIISSGGNSGSQATSLIIRSLALREVRLRDWWRVLRRELVVGSSLGAILGTIGMIRIMVWPNRQTLYGEHYKLIASTVAISLVGIVLWGSLAGSMLPFLLRRLGFDPATASAPFVATLVDVTGLVIYFTVASLMLGGVLL
ncbi:MAG: magnesium transporter [Proteobacteria bacterium]|nr:MAG: magnesium transporter [Pseudomonadota bacterium]